VTDSLIIQGSPEWLAARAGLATASEFATILTKGRTKDAPSVVRQKYAMRLALERLTGVVDDPVDFPQTLHGKEQERFAIMAYEIHTGNMIERVGFVRHDTLMAGCSPDGRVDKNGGTEVKCPANREVHALTLLHGMPKEHIPQVQGNMWIDKRDWWDFISYCPSMPDGMKLYIQRIERDDKYIATLEKEVTIFCNEVSAVVLKLKERAA